MKSKKIPIPIVVILLLALIVVGYFIIRLLLPKPQENLAFSGTIEAVQISIAPEASGKVVEVYFNEGDQVKAGDLLIQFDPALLLGQQFIAQQNLDFATSALNTVKAQFAITQDTVDLQSAAARTAGWFGANLNGYPVPGGSYTQSELVTAAEREVKAALKNRDARLADLTELLAKPASAKFASAEANLLAAGSSYTTAKQVLDKANLSANTDLIDAAQDAYDSAKSKLDDAQSTYDDLKDTSAAEKIINSRAKLSVAQERYDTARDNLLKLQYGSESPQLSASQAAVDQAQAAVDQAQAQVDLTNVQLSKLRIISPINGTVITRSVEAGEVLAQGATAMILADINQLEVTVFVPEDLYGQLAIGQPAAVSVDSYPGDYFKGTVSRIADQAEFTPRNVQTVEGRKTTVFAIKLLVENPEGKLKPGMPADVMFAQ